MSKIIEEFTIGRNINSSSTNKSANNALEVARAIDSGADLTEDKNKGLRNRFWAHKSHTGLFSGEPSDPKFTKVADKFFEFCNHSKVDAFRWLITRALWLFVVPNGSNADVNKITRKKGIEFDFFRLILRVLTLLRSEPGVDRFLFYDEFFSILEDDENWNIEPLQFFRKVIRLREQNDVDNIDDKKSILQLEQYYSDHKNIEIGRDNINTIFSKSFNNTGIFEPFRLSSGGIVGISIYPDLDEELSRRVRFVLDNPVGWDPNEQEWEEYLAYRGEENDFPFEVAESHQSPPVATTDSLSTLVERAHEDFRDAGFIVDKQLVRRFVASLLTKPFVILTGLSGSGKTRLAQLFASWLTPETDARYHEVVAVGADWTSGDDILGYPDALDENRYVKTPALNLLIRAEENFDSGAPTLPFFLILDEMNLSHVERYFSDFLSALESREEIELHGDTDDEGKADIRDGVRGRMKVPPNLFIIGTVNVDETTYTFSPKVLDRANSIEFRASEEAMDSFLDDPAPIEEEILRGMGGDFAQSFAQSAQTDAPSLNDDDAELVKEEVMALFKSLRSEDTGFAFRVGKEITRFVRYHRLLTSDGSSWQVSEALDAQILQKVLPKFNGSRDQLESPLCSLSVLCTNPRPWRSGDENDDDETQGLEELVSKARETTERRDEEYPIEEYPVDGDDSLRTEIGEARYPLSYEKIVRMLGRLDRDGFANFAEA